MTGRYLGSEPLAHAKNASTVNAIYSYAASQPTRTTDPSGLFILMDTCTNFYPALAEARKRAGCGGSGGGGSGPSDCDKCKKKKDECGACDICQFLDSQSWPIVRIVDDPHSSDHLPIDGNTRTWEDTKDGVVVSTGPVIFRGSLCTGSGMITRFADAMIEEAAHMCTGWQHIPDEKGKNDGCIAQNIVDACR